MSIKLYQLYCDGCHWKRITDGSDVDDLVEVKRSPIPGGIPKIDPVTKKLNTPKEHKLPKRFKCPGCGRLVIPRKIDDPQAALERLLEEEQRAEIIKAAEVEQEKRLQKSIAEAEAESSKRRNKFEQEKSHPFDGG